MYNVHAYWIATKYPLFVSDKYEIVAILMTYDHEIGPGLILFFQNCAKDIAEGFLISHHSFVLGFLRNDSF